MKIVSWSSNVVQNHFTKQLSIPICGKTWKTLLKMSEKLLQNEIEMDKILEGIQIINR